MGLPEIRTEIKNLLETVPGIGKVHDYERWTNEWKTFLSYFKDSENRINGWVITRSGAQERLHAAGAVNISTHSFVIKGYYGLKDSKESEKAFQDLIEAIRSVLRTHDNLNGSCLTSDPPQVSILSPSPYAGVLTHRCEILPQAERQYYNMLNDYDKAILKEEYPRTYLKNGAILFIPEDIYWLAKAIFWGAGKSDEERRAMAWEIRSHRESQEGTTYKDVVTVPGEYSPKITDDELLKETIRDDAKWQSWDRTVWIATDVAGAPDFDNPLQKDATPMWPVKSRQITSGFGTRTHPITGEPDYHYGIDIKASLGEGVYATESGMVVETAPTSKGANRVIIKGVSGYYTFYIHMTPSVRYGQKVKKGNLIGHVDRSGRITGPHLHFGVSPNEDPRNGVNPEGYLP